MEPLFLIAGMTTVTLASPGPNNLMVFTLASQRGASAALPAMFGVQLGGLMLIALCSLGVTQLLLDRPEVQSTARITGLLYLLAIGLMLILKAPNPAHSTGANTALSRAPFTGLLFFQLLNPKAWLLMTTLATVLSAYYSGVAAFLWQSVVFLVASGITLSLWLGAGNALHRRLGSNLMRPAFTRAMGMLLACTAFCLLIRE